MRAVARFTLLAIAATASPAAEDLWTLARRKAEIHRFSTLFTAQNVRDYLSTEEGLAQAAAWCRENGVTKVYLETYRSQYRAPKETLLRAKAYFRRAGLLVSGCVTTTKVGKISTGWKLISCYTNRRTQQELKEIFEYTAGLFDEIMIDDFFFTDCTCEECDRARRSREVEVEGKRYLVGGDRWEDYRGELMFRVAEQLVLKAAKAVNPRAKLIIKYPQWYDRFHERGYDVDRETRIFDYIWVGTETRDVDKRGRMQYAAYFLMRWLGGIGGAKTGGGWFDPLQTTERTYVEQARQTVLAGAKETVLFCYGALHRNFGPEDLAALRTEIPELLEVAGEVRRRKAVGIAAYKPPNSPPEDDEYVFDHVGMLGFPLEPVHEFPADAEALFLPMHALADKDLGPKLMKFLATQRPVLVTEGLARRLSGKWKLDAENLHLLRAGAGVERLLEMSQTKLDALREAMLEPFGVTFRSPPGVGLYLFSDGSWVVENFNDRGVTVKIDGDLLTLGPRAWAYRWK